MADWNPKANEIFLRAVEIDSPDDRGRYLDEVCQADVALRAEVESLLAASEQAGSFLESPPAGLTAAAIGESLPEHVGSIVGPYKLLEQIGEGGMGVVFMAEQTQPVRRKVALKLIKPGMDTRNVIARFEAERQALAVMDHPGIARVLDAGATPAGHPYFAMELVRGVPITAYCDEQNLPIRERLELFASVCQAVQHAHGKGIIHRDIKPSNVLVTRQDGRAVVKVIDFGVAKAMGQQLTENTLFTNFAQMIGTPLYMSPEQAEASGVDIDTRSDIYSLGVLLYELLTGTTPVSTEQLQKAGFDEIRRIIREQEPLTPSARISSSQSLPAIAAHRHIEPVRLTRLMRGELDWIVMKALEKDRNRRYETANAFAADILHHLHDEPVQACPPSASYRFRKLARRNRAALATISVVAAALLAGTVLSTWQAVRARRAERLADARLVAEKKAREAETALRKQAEAQQAAAEVFVKDVYQAAENMSKTDDWRELLFERALALTEELARGFPSQPDHLERAGHIHRFLGWIAEADGRFDEARSHLEKGAAAFKQLAAGHFPKGDRYYGGLHGDALASLAIVLRKAGKPSEAEETVREAIRICRAASGDESQPLAFALSALAQLLAERKEYLEAEASYREVIPIWEKLVTRSPTNEFYRWHLADSHRSLGNVLRAVERYDEAEASCRKAIAVWEKLVAESPTNQGYRWHLAGTHDNLTYVLRAVERHEEAEASCQKAIAIWEQLVAESPTNQDFRHHLGWSRKSSRNSDSGNLKSCSDLLKQPPQTSPR